MIHIPLSLYPHFIHPILKLLALLGIDAEHEDGTQCRPWAFYYPFANISVTTFECSIVCPRHLVEELFIPILERLDSEAQSAVSISRDDFVAIQVGGSGTAAAQRVLDLTAPLALAGISIFFITSYYSDFLLVPQRSRHTVVSALESQGFAFERRSSGFEQMTNVASPLHNRRQKSSSSGFDFHLQTPATPPPASIAEWQVKTFATLKRNKVVPNLDATLTLASAGGHRADRAMQARLTHYLTAAFLETPPPRFLSLTMTDTDSASITPDRALLRLFPNAGADTLLFSDELTVPIVLDLRGLPDASAGIVCGVAGRLLEHMHAQHGAVGFNMSYLSTAKAGNVLVREDEVEDALAALRAVQAVDP